MSSSNPTEERTDESTDDQGESRDDGLPPEVLAESIRNKTAALAEQGDDLADELDRLADADEDAYADVDADADAGEIDPAAMMTELLETASDLVAVAHQIEDARAQE